MKTQPLFHITSPAVLSIRPRLFSALALLSCMTLVSRAHAANGTWTGGGADGNWLTLGNWLGGIVAGASAGGTDASLATFDNNVNTTVLLTADRSLNSILFSGSSVGAFTLTGSGGRFQLSTNGSIQTTSSVTTVQTITAGLNVRGVAAAYSVLSNGADATSMISLSGVVTAGSDGTIVTLGGSNTNANTSSGGIGTLITATGRNGTLGILKANSGTWTITGAAGATFTLGTTVSTGTLLVSNASGSGTGTGFVTVDSAGTLGGRGFIAPTAGTNVTINGTLSPGDLTAATGTLTFNASGASKVNFGASSHLALTLGTSSDLVAFTTSGDWLGGSGNVTLDITGGAGFLTGTAYNIFSNITTAGFTLAGVTYNGSALGVSDYTFGLNGTNYEINISAIPEAKTWIMIGIGLTFALWRKRRRSF